MEFKIESSNHKNIAESSKQKKDSKTWKAENKKKNSETWKVNKKR